MLDKNSVKIPERFINHPIFNGLICGTNFGFMAKRGYYLSEEAKAQPGLMAKSGINWTTLNMNFCQDRYYSQKVYLDFEFSTGEYELIEMTKRLHDNGIKILFKPCLTPLDGQWMGNVSFPSTGRQIQGVENDYWDKWFKSFTEAEKYFADLAEKAGMDAMIIGAEYHGTESENERWENVITEIRNLYFNPITYEVLHYSLKISNLNWLKNLDFLSISYYPPAGAPNTTPLSMDYNPVAKDMPSKTVEEMVQYLEPQKAEIASICDRFGGMPIAFTEYGTRSAHGCIMKPANYMWNSYYDGDEQANYMEASFRTFWDLPQWMGFFWWKWDETQHRPHYHTDPAGDMGFTIQGKPAEQIMRNWIKKSKTD